MRVLVSVAGRQLMKGKNVLKLLDTFFEAVARTVSSGGLGPGTFVSWLQMAPLPRGQTVRAASGTRHRPDPQQQQRQR